MLKKVLRALIGGPISAQFFNRDIWANFEVAAVLLSAAGKFIFIDWLRQDMWFALAAGGAWLAYIAVRIRRQPHLIHAWGFSSKNLKSTALIVTPVTAAAVAGAVLYGLLSGQALLHWHMWIVLLLYPAWGVVQQFLLVVLVAGNLDRMSRGRLPRLLIVLPTALLFGVVHIPVPILMGITFFMGCFTTAMFLRYRSVWALGVFHGLLATALYYFVLGQDPLNGFLQAAV
ncbi:MAG TPA: CPBP family intramembrane glutamic endopeptidase [Clostridia bacterium]|nr:CPBP family intramembrane glutamic endopeptidase [Clostridia bacterium]